MRASLAVCCCGGPCSTLPLTPSSLFLFLFLFLLLPLLLLLCGAESLKAQLDTIQETLRTELQLTKASTEQKLDSIMCVEFSCRSFILLFFAKPGDLFCEQRHARFWKRGE